MIYQIAYVLFCIFLAYHNGKLIKKDKSINHKLNGILHLVCWVAIYLLSKSVVLLIIMPFLGRLFFDTALCLFRGLRWDYVSPWVKQGRPQSSVTDRIEWKIFKSGKWPKIVYAVIVIALNFFL